MLAYQAYNNSSSSPGFFLALVLSALARPNLLGTNDCMLDKQLSLAIFLGILMFGFDLYLKYLGKHFPVIFFSPILLSNSEHVMSCWLTSKYEINIPAL